MECIRLWRWFMPGRFVRPGCAVALMLLPLAAAGQPFLTNHSLSFEAATDRLIDSSHALRAAQSRYASKTDTAEALKSLDLPSLSIDAEGLKYQKTIKPDQIDIDSVSISNLPFSTPISLPVSTSSLPKLDKLTFSQSTVRSALNATWVLYSGGKITATQKAAKSMADQAQAGISTTRDGLMFELVRLYFGQQLAGKVVILRRNLAKGMKEHLDNALKMEKNGMLTRAQRLQAQVAYDSALRAYNDAEYDYNSAKIALRNLLNASDTVQPTTELFVLTNEIEPRESFLRDAQVQNPKLRELDALKSASEQEIEATRASWLPKVFLFGQYNLNRSGETPLDPDWIAGVGVTWPISSNVDRRRSISAARNTLEEVKSTAEEARNAVDTQTRQAFDAVENARRQYQLLQANLVSATENVRVQELSFREGMGTSTEVTDARIALNNILVERATAAYRYDVELARLLHATGQIDQFHTYLNRSDKVNP